MAVGEPGIKNIRNFMANYFPEKQRIFFIDDDISHIFEAINKTDDKKDKKKTNFQNSKP